MSLLADTHCHLYFNLFTDDLPDVIHRALDRGVEKLMVPGLDLETSRRAVELCDAFPAVFAAVGVHPNEAQVWNSEMLNDLSSLLKHPKVVAVGEIGLDFYRNIAPVELQERAFMDQLDLAADLEKVVIIHSRAATPRLLALLDGWQSCLQETISSSRGVLHSFEGTLEEAMWAVENRFMIGIGGPVTYTNAHEKQVLAKELPITSILLETDAPFLTPHPYRGQRNEPARIYEIAKKIASIRECEFDKIAEATSKNADSLFGWSSFR